MATTAPSGAVTGPRSATMRAIVQDTYGDADVLRLDDVPIPTIADGEVLVEVHAAGLDRGTWHLMTGTPLMIRPAFGLRGPRNPVPGRDVAGRVVAVGSGVTRFAVGDEVHGIAEGTLAEYAAAREDKLAAKPPTLTFEQAAVVPISGLTALQGLRDAGRIDAGQEVLVIGASGGVGTYAVQVAKALGARVTGVCSGAKADLVRSLGADHVIDYTTSDPTEGDRRYDLILDLGGNRPLSRLRRVLTPTGTLVVAGGEEGGRWTGGIDRQLRAVAWSPFVRQRLTMLLSKETHTDLERLGELIETGAVTPVVDGTHSLDEAPEAMRRLAAGEVRGKVAVAVRPAGTG